MANFGKLAELSLFGIGFGAGLPVLALAYDEVAGAGDQPLIEAFAASPVHGIAALTPLALGTAFHLFGRNQARLKAQRDAARHAEANLRRQMEDDGVTGLHTRAALVGRLKQLVADKPAVVAGKIHVVQIETDGVRFVNDTLGMAAGDELLALIGKRLSSIAGPKRECFRLGGDDFVILSVGSSEDLDEFAHRVAATFDEHFDIAGSRIPVVVHVGAASLGPIDSVGTEVLTRCDLALERARQAGGDSVGIFSGELVDEARQRMQLEQELQLAIDRGEFFLVFQPIIDIATKATKACEALLRWQHPARGVVSPTDFIPLAEKSGLISRIGELVLHKACAEAVNWPEPVKISVNVSPAQFKDRNFYPQVVEALQRSGLPGSRLVLEITESLLIDNMDLVQHTFDRLRELGVRFALDDFGTGFSSINHLRTLKLDTLKLDKSFADRIVTDTRELGVVRSIIDLSRAFDMNTTIEGVESLQQLEMMRNQGIQNAQGFYFARPMSARDVRRLLKNEAVPPKFEIAG